MACKLSGKVFYLRERDNSWGTHKVETIPPSVLGHANEYIVPFDHTVAGYWCGKVSPNHGLSCWMRKGHPGWHIACVGRSVPEHIITWWL